MFVLFIWFQVLFCTIPYGISETVQAVQVDHEIVYLPLNFSVQQVEDEESGKKLEEISLQFSAFGRPISLKLKENNLISPEFKTYLVNGENTTVFSYRKMNCHFIHADASVVAAISNCHPKFISGFIFLENSTLEINPLTYKQQLQEEFENSVHNNVPHIIKRASHSRPPIFNRNPFFINDKLLGRQPFPKRKTTNNPNLSLEVALFFDEAAYKIFSPYMSYDDEKLRDMVLAYLNAVQALYKHPSIGNPLNIVLVRMDIMKVQPRRLPHYDGDRSQLLNSFCEYQHELNSQDDQYDEHWDMALYVSGLDFFAYENGRKNGATMGLATVGGVCYSRYSCIIAEFGTTNIFGKPYPSAGFTSVYILAHEIGHNLGMHHDNNGNSCSKDGYIMSPSRGTQGETIWSPCSADVMYNLGWADCLKDKGKQKQQLNHSKFMEHPGMTYTAKRQCELLLRDKDAYVVPENDLGVICYSLRCQTPHRSGYYFAGPALEGTDCGNNLYCYGGDCIKRLPKPITLKPGGWGPWRLSDCKSGCIEKSTGYQIQQRDCNNPSPLNTDKGCEGLSYQHVLCEDTNICKTNRKSAIQYASEKCKLFASKVPELDPKGAGLQSSHENNRLWMGCAIFCRRHEGSYYTPRIELNDVGIDPYFPDGTWCHNENGEDYYCNNRHCLAESFAFSKNWFKGHMSTNMDIPQNAIPNNVVPPEFKSFLSLGSDGKPLKIDSDFRISLPKNEDWETDDYVLLPNIDA